jgi:hypothetical protein
MDQFEPIAPCPPDGGFSLPHQAASLIFIISDYQRSSAVSSEMIRLWGDKLVPRTFMEMGRPRPVSVEHRGNFASKLDQSWRSRHRRVFLTLKSQPLTLN